MQVRAVVDGVGQVTVGDSSFRLAPAPATATAWLAASPTTANALATRAASKSAAAGARRADRASRAATTAQLERIFGER